MSLDPVIHAPKRLAVMALLAHAHEADFRFLRDHLDVSDSILSKQMSALADAGYIKISKNGHGRGATTIYQITRSGRRAYANYRAALDSILNAQG